MNRKQLIIAIVLCVVLSGLGWLAYQKNQADYGSAESASRAGDEGNKLFPKFPVNDIAQLTVRQKTNSLTLVKKDDLWTVKERGGYPANFNTLREFIQKMWEIRITRALPKATPKQIEKLELVAPDKGPGTLVEFKDQAGKPLDTLLLGAKSMREGGGESPFGGPSGGFPNGRYVMAHGNAKAVALVSETFNNIEPKAEDWLSKDWFKVEKLKSAAVVFPAASNNWTLQRETDNGEWKLAAAGPTEYLDSSKTSSLNWMLNSPSFDDVLVGAKPEETGLDKPAAVATLTTFDGFTYTLKIGRKNTNEDSKVTLQVAVQGDFPKARTPGKDEKAEDKTKLDKEFKEKTDKLMEKLKTEKAFDPWTYQVSKYTVENLLKERKEFLSTNAPVMPTNPPVSLSPTAALEKELLQVKPAVSNAAAKPIEIKPLETPSVQVSKPIEVKTPQPPSLAMPPKPTDVAKPAVKPAGTNQPAVPKPAEKK